MSTDLWDTRNISVIWMQNRSSAIIEIARNFFNVYITKLDRIFCSFLRLFGENLEFKQLKKINFWNFWRWRILHSHDTYGKIGFLWNKYDAYPYFYIFKKLTNFCSSKLPHVCLIVRQSMQYKCFNLI